MECGYALLIRSLIGFAIKKFTVSDAKIMCTLLSPFLCRSPISADFSVATGGGVVVWGGDGTRDERALYQVLI